MSTRGAARRARPTVAIDLRAFGWDRALIATLRHSTLPWLDEVVPGLSVEAIPLADLAELGARDRLSLVAQFAAHQALLQFAGFSDAECDSAEWAVVRKRGSDCRLIRIAARVVAEDAPPALTVIQQFAEAVAAPELDALRQSWGRAESVYLEIDSRLRRDAVADLRWMRSAAWGEVASPGAETLREILRAPSGRFRAGDDNCAAVIRAAATLGNERVLEIGADASPLQRYSAIAPLTSLIGPLDRKSEAEIAERVVEIGSRERLIFLIRCRDRFDAASLRAIDMLAGSDAGTWIVSDGGDADLPPSRFLVVSPGLAALRELEQTIGGRPLCERRGWIEQFVHSSSFVRYLDGGELPHDDRSDALTAIREPLRSYLAAVALLGTRIPLDIATNFLQQLLFGDRADDLVVDGVTSIEDACIVFASDAVRNAAKQLIPASSQPTLCRVAAGIIEASGDRAGAAALLIEAGDARAAASLLERIEWTSNRQALRVLRSLPGHALTPALARTLATALLDEGRYRDARDVASVLTDDALELMLARISRRTGDYGPALARLDRIRCRGFKVEILRAELLYLERRYEEMRASLDLCAPTTDEDRILLDYLRALLAHETGSAADVDLPPDHYFAARLETYRAFWRRDLGEAAKLAAVSLQRARSIAERIDAALDRLFLMFTAGAWAEARDEALRTLALVDETQGDRAAGGVLFMLAYLAADDGQWAHAAQRIHRLRHFYRGMQDERRLLELDLLAAHLDFSRGRFAEAAHEAQAVVDLGAQIREAAALILDEIDWIEGRKTALRSTGLSGNVELAERHQLMRIRRGVSEDAGQLRTPFMRALAKGEAVRPATGSEALKCFRDALGRGNRELAEAIATEWHIELPTHNDKAMGVELHVLRAAATREFPFGPRDLGSIGWRFATRNRLGQWQEIGSLAALPPAELDDILSSGAADWIVCSDRELLHIDGISNWTAESRDAIAALLRTRAEHHRMRRLIEQEESARESRTEIVDGIIGESATMRGIFGTITRVARRDVPVCILGESGTGKELVARAIHRHSARRSKPFTAVNCAALPENLIESELFGHTRGAFTGADRDRAGLIESSDGGTLFLDEIGEMPLAAQAKLLRFLQEGEFRRVGDSVNRTADVRIVSATNRKLETAVEEGQFREDLYYRIGGIEILLPSLRERASDIILLAAHFLAGEREKHRGGPSKLSPDAESLFLSYRWPGNVRELQNTIRAAHALAGESPIIDVDHLPERMRNSVGVMRAGHGGVHSYQDAVTRFRRELIEKSLAQANGNQNRAASMLSMSRQALAYQIRELGILVKGARAT